MATTKPIGDPAPASQLSVASVLRTLFSDSVIYLIGAALMGLVSFALVPLYTRVLSPRAFGVYALIDITLLILVTITQLKLDVAYLKFYAETEESCRAALLTSVLTTGAVTSAFAGLAFAAFTASTVGRAVYQTDDVSFAWILLPIIVLEAVQGLLLANLRARRQAVAYCASTIIRLLATVIASVWFLSFHAMGLNGLFLGRMVGDIAGAAVLLAISARQLGRRLDPRLVRPMVRFGLPLVWSALMMLLLDASGRYFLSHVGTIEQVGYLGAAIKISSIFQMLINQPIGIAWGGLMFQIIKWPNARLIYSKILSYVFVLAVCASLCLFLTTPVLFSIFATPAYAPAMLVFPLILLVRVVGVLEYPAAISIYLSGHTEWFAGIYTAALVLNLTMNFLLDRPYGMMGAAWAWLIAWIAIIVPMAKIGQRFYRLDYDFKLLGIATLPWIVVVLIPASTMSRFLHSAGALQMAMLPVTIAAFGFLLYRDIAKLRKTVA